MQALNLKVQKYLTEKNDRKSLLPRVGEVGRGLLQPDYFFCNLQIKSLMVN